MSKRLKSVNRILLILCILLGFVSIYMKDADKAPIYFLLAYIFWRLK